VSSIPDTPDVLARIVATKLEEMAVAKGARPLETWIAELDGLPPTRDFKAAITRGGAGPARVIAEVKKASPSKGVIREDFDPVAIATGYEKGGASAISVLTDEKYFQGSADYLKAVRQAVDLPLLRKDFTIDPYQIYEARLWGADAVLLIAAILTTAQLHKFRDLANGLGLAALVEVHTAPELESAVASGADIIGINNRNLSTFDTTLETTYELVKGIPDGAVKISESGIFTATQVRELEQGGGIDAILVGESLMRQDDVTRAVMELIN
jgi:indole-3-glycerol phosphate synthase